MKFFNLKNKAIVLCDLNGNIPVFEIRMGEMTENLNDLKFRIERQLKARNFDVPGIDVEFSHSIDDSDNKIDKHTIKVFSIGSKEHDIHMTNSHIRVAGIDLRLYNDMSGSLEIYCGNSWAADRNEFVNGVRHHRKMNNKSRIVLQYDTHNGRNFEATCDGNRGYLPEGSEPLSYTISDIENMLMHPLMDFLEYIESHNVHGFDKTLFAEPDPTLLTNPLFAKSIFFTNIDRSQINKMNDPEYKGNYGMQGGVRLLPLSINYSKAHPYTEYMNDGFVYCDILWADGTVYNNNLHYVRDDSPRVALKLNKMDNVFIIDQDAADAFKDKWFAENTDESYMDNASANQMMIERAATMVHINDYKGNYKKPIMIINRAIAKEEIVTVGRQSIKNRNKQF